MVLVQKWPFFQLFFLGNIGQENVFYDILERNIAFLDYEYKFLGVIRIKLGPFFSGEKQIFHLSQRFLPPTGYITT